MMRRALILATTLMAGACTAVPPTTPGVAPPPPPTRLSAVGLERVLGQTESGLVGVFGKPNAEVSEGAGRKLQFAGAICVLDAYLYPKAGGGVPVVAHVDARQRDGRAIDRASCVAALTRRDGGR